MSAERLSNQAVFFGVRKGGAQAGVKSVSPHDMRCTFISDLWDAGVDGSTIQRLAGHASITTTQRYDRRGDEAKRRTADMLHLPHARRAP